MSMRYLRGPLPVVLIVTALVLIQKYAPLDQITAHFGKATEPPAAAATTAAPASAPVLPEPAAAGTQRQVQGQDLQTASPPPEPPAPPEPILVDSPTVDVADSGRLAGVADGIDGRSVTIPATTALAARVGTPSVELPPGIAAAQVASVATTAATATTGTAIGAAQIAPSTAVAVPEKPPAAREKPASPVAKPAAPTARPKVVDTPVAKLEKPAAPAPARPVAPPAPPPRLRVFVEADTHERAGLGQFKPAEYAGMLRGELLAVAGDYLGPENVQRDDKNLAFRDALSAGRAGIDALCESAQAPRVLLADVSVPSAGFSSLPSAYWPEVTFTAISCADGRVHKSQNQRLEPHRLDQFEYQQLFAQRSQTFIASQGYFLKP